MTTGVELARRYPTARLVFTGGSAGLLGEGPAEAIGARKLWLSLGVPAERMTFEAKSRDTWENALFTRDLVKPKPGETWLLVTSAWHMPRSVGIFRHLGFDVIPYPVAYRTFGNERDFLQPASVIDKVIMLDYSVREWVGLLAYRLAGKTDALTDRGVFRIHNDGRKAAPPAFVLQAQPVRLGKMERNFRRNCQPRP